MRGEVTCIFCFSREKDPAADDISGKSLGFSCPTKRLALGCDWESKGGRGKHGRTDGSCVYSRVSNHNTTSLFLHKQCLTSSSIAGGETIAAFLAAVTFYLCKSPAAMRNLQQEIRSHFPTYPSISSSKALQLPFLQAVISEGLRIYPPSPQGLPRVSPGAVVDGFWVPKGVSRSCQNVLFAFGKVLKLMRPRGLD